MGEPLATAQTERRAAVQLAVDLLHQAQGRLAEVQAVVAQGRAAFPVARIVGGLAGVHPAPPPPAEYVAAAADGSQIDVDRHAAVRCFLLNVGSAVLRYGPAADAALDSRPWLAYREEDLSLVHPTDPEQREPLTGPLLQARRDVAEAEGLARLLAVAPPDVPLVGLIDNALTLWGVVGQRLDEWVIAALLRQYYEHLDAIRALPRQGSHALGGYISRPGGSGVVGLLRQCGRGGLVWEQALTPGPSPVRGRGAASSGISVSPLPTVGEGPGVRGTDSLLAQLLDRDLFAAILTHPGDRSDVFASPLAFRAHDVPESVRDLYRGNEVHFFYLSTGDEIARVEVPPWVAADPARLDLVHAVVADQVRRGEGYPVALAEAHEQAIVGVGDRAVFWELVEGMAAARRIPFDLSGKASAKRRRGL